MKSHLLPEVNFLNPLRAPPVLTHPPLPSTSRMSDDDNPFQCPGCQKEYSKQSEYKKHCTKCNAYASYHDSYSSGLLKTKKKTFKSEIRSIKKRLKRTLDRSSSVESGRMHDLPVNASTRSTFEAEATASPPMLSDFVRLYPIFRRSVSSHSLIGHGSLAREEPGLFVS